MKLQKVNTQQAIISVYQLSLIIREFKIFGKALINQELNIDYLSLTKLLLKIEVTDLLCNEVL